MVKLCSPEQKFGHKAHHALSCPSVYKTQDLGQVRLGQFQKDCPRELRNLGTVRSITCEMRHSQKPA